MPKLFVDLDGVLADFDSMYRTVFGKNPDRTKEPPGMWETIKAQPAFFAGMPKMPGADLLWTYIADREPVILSGVPKEFPQAAEQKRAWVDEHIGKTVPLVCCQSKHKCLHCNYGDVLIDDWHKYAHLWHQAGGIFLLHTAADSTIRHLKALGL